MKGFLNMFKNVYKFKNLNDASQNCIRAFNNKDLLNKKQVLKLFRNINNQLIKNNIVNDLFTFNNYDFDADYNYMGCPYNDYEYHHVVLCRNNAFASPSYEGNYIHYDDYRPSFYNKKQPTADVFRIRFYKKESIKRFLLNSLKKFKDKKEEYLIIKNILLKTKLIHKRSFKNV